MNLLQKIVHDYGVLLTLVGRTLIRTGCKLHIKGVTVKLAVLAPWIIKVNQRAVVAYEAEDAEGTVYRTPGDQI